jgi:hypothetical protein
MGELKKKMAHFQKIIPGSVVSGLHEITEQMFNNVRMLWADNVLNRRTWDLWNSIKMYVSKKTAKPLEAAIFINSKRQKGKAAIHERGTVIHRARPAFGPTERKFKDKIAPTIINKLMKGYERG